MSTVITTKGQIKIEKSLLETKDLVLFKNNKNCYLGCNDALAEYNGLATAKDCIGKNDLMFPWRIYRPIYLSNDQLVVKHKQSFYFIEPAKGANNKIIDCLAIKAPLYTEENTIAGIQGISISLENIPFNKVLEKFIDGSKKFNLELEPSKMIQIITQVIKTNNCKKQWDKESKLFDYGKICFSFREAQCLHYFFNHYSAEKTSREIFISKKTVEFHLANIKQKLNCFNTTELTNLAIDYGFIDLMFMPF